MPWNPISSDDVKSELTPIEVATVEGLQGANDLLPAILEKVILKVRGQIKAGGNQVDPVNALTVPDQLQGEVIAITRWRWLNSIPGLKDNPMLSDGRRQAAEDAESLLREISSLQPDRPRTELPANVDASPAPIVRPAFGHRRLHPTTNSDLNA